MTQMERLMSSAFGNQELFEELYKKYQANPDQVSEDWQKAFREIEQSEEKTNEKRSSQIAEFPTTPRESVSIFKSSEEEVVAEDERICRLINAYRSYGHLMAKTNPLAREDVPETSQLSLSALGFSKEDLSHPFPTCGLMDEATASLQKIIEVLKNIYCNQIGVEYMELHSPEMEKWLQQHIEPSRFRIHLSIEEKQVILNHLNKSELFESFLQTKYTGQKRFSLEGCETLVPIMQAVIETGVKLGADEFVIGMAHRGRLNILSNILNKSYSDIFSEFEEGYIPDSFEGSGDVKYHKGFSSEVKTLNGKKVKIFLTPNPSHLESVDPVVEGQVRAMQVLKNDLERQEQVIPILVHGDAALSGQGIVYETMQFNKLPGYSTGGTIHLVINNQIGFTTLPEEARSTFYCTDIALAFGCPVFHVNAEDPEGCIYATNLAVEMRQKFHCDVFIDLMCYRKYGHNETDEPAFTQPLEYQIIRKKKPIREIYRDNLIHQGELEKYLAEGLETEFKKTLQLALKETKSFQGEAIEKRESKTEVPSSFSYTEANSIFESVETGVPRETVRAIAQKICNIPEGFSIHPKLGHLLKERLLMVSDDTTARPVDWGMAELLAYGSLLWQGISVRLSGQDSCRGTFSHRHATWIDQTEEKKYSPLNHLQDGQGRFDVLNSPLSEYAVLGFEFGYSITHVNALVLWEAQFGDFCNGAQVIIDQYISTAEQKWGKKSHIVLLLPHGYEGQGPEHSSARMERFLTLAGNQNMQIVNPTTPAQLFHLLRRQMLGNFIKPLIIFTPKGLLRHPECVSRLGDFSEGSFLEVLDDPAKPKNVRRLIFCSGRIYYDLIASRLKSKINDLAIVRLEQLYPLNVKKIQSLIEQYKGFHECIWVQEEPSNMGAWGFIHSYLEELLPENMKLKYVGRDRSASPAAGSYALHKREHAALINALFNPSQQTLFGTQEYQVRV